MMTTASWCGFAALGSGLILCAVAAGADPLLAAPLVAVAAVELVWGAAALRSGRVPVPRTAIVVGAGIVAVATALLFLGVAGVIPLLALLVLHWTAAVLTALAFRRGQEARGGSAGVGGGGDRAAVGDATGEAGGRGTGASDHDGPEAAGRSRVRSPRPAAFVLILTAQAMLVAAITTPALAHTSPGESALPHGTLHGPHAH